MRKGEGAKEGGKEGRRHMREEVSKVGLQQVGKAARDVDLA